MPTPVRRCAALVVLLAVLATAGPARAQEERPTPRGLVDTPGTEGAISPSLDGIEVDGDEYRLVDRRLRTGQGGPPAGRVPPAHPGRRRARPGPGHGPGGCPRPPGSEPRWGAGPRRVRTLAVRAYIGAGGDGDAVLAGLDPGYTRPERRALL